MRTVRGDSDRSATRDSSAHPGRGPPGKGKWGRTRQGCTFKTRQCLNRQQAERRSSPALDVAYQLWGTGGACFLLQSTLLVPSGEPQGQHQGPSTALLPPLPLQNSRSTYRSFRPWATSLLLAPGDSEASKVGMNL